MRNETFSLAVVNQRATSRLVSIVIDRRGEKREKKRGGGETERKEERNNDELSRHGESYHGRTVGS